MAIEILQVAPGSLFKVDGVEYTLVKVPGDGFNWMGANGKYALCQNFYYYDGLPTLDYLESLKKYLPAHAGLGCAA